jgi:O-antigen/teichoic acid export membrane protein
MVSLPPQYRKLRDSKEQECRTFCTDNQPGMNKAESILHSQQLSHGHLLFRGTILVFLAEVLLPVTGIVTASFLTRKLGASDYGLLVLASTLISWIELAITSLFSRAAVKLVSDSVDWRPIGATLLRLHAYISLGALAVCWMSAKPLAALLGEPRLAGCFALFALDIPIFSLAHCHRSLLVGRGRYTERAKASAGRWIARLLLILFLVQIGLSLQGAILGNIGASLAELVLARCYIRPSWKERMPSSAALWNYAIPIFLGAIALRFMGLGLFLLKMLGASAAQAGIYGAAQNISFVMPGILAVSISPLLLSTVSRVLRDKDLDAARLISRNAIRAVIAALPFAAMAAAASDAITVLLFGRHFAGSGPLMEILVFAGISMILINLQNAILIASGNPSWILKLTAPLLPLAVAGHLLAIPVWGPAGAASITAAVTCLGALIGLIAVRRRLGVPLPMTTLIRALLLSGTTYALLHIWPASGLALLAQMAAVTLLIAGGFILLGELQRNEVRFLRSVLLQALKNIKAASRMKPS